MIAKPHIRVEETELFKTAQRLLGPGVLAHLEQAPTDARQTVHGPAEPNSGRSS
jgi:hypothetical protein